MKLREAAWRAGYRAGRAELARALPIGSLAVRCATRHTHGPARASFLDGWVAGARSALVEKKIVKSMGGPPA